MLDAEPRLRIVLIATYGPRDAARRHRVRPIPMDPVALRAKIGSYPDYVGSRDGHIDLAFSVATPLYEVRPGGTCASIAATLGIPIGDLLASQGEDPALATDPSTRDTPLRSTKQRSLAVPVSWGDVGLVGVSCPLRMVLGS